MKISIIVHPNSKNPHTEEDMTGMLHVFVKSPPLEGKANQEVIEKLSEHFQVPKGNIVLVKGGKSKNKTFIVQTP